MPNTYTLIASNTVGSGGAASITFSSIPSTYTDLAIKVSFRNTADNANWQLSFNGVTTNLSDIAVGGNGAAANSYSDATLIYGFICRSTNTANTFSNSDIYIPNYAGSTYKSISMDSVTENNATTAFAYLTAGLWQSTSAITSVVMTPTSGNFAQYSTAYLYGIKNS